MAESNESFGLSSEGKRDVLNSSKPNWTQRVTNRQLQLTNDARGSE